MSQATSGSETSSQKRVMGVGAWDQPAAVDVLSLGGGAAAARVVGRDGGGGGRGGWALGEGAGGGAG